MGFQLLDYTEQIELLALHWQTLLISFLLFRFPLLLLLHLVVFVGIAESNIALKQAAMSLIGCLIELVQSKLSDPQTKSLTKQLNWQVNKRHWLRLTPTMSQDKGEDKKLPHVFHW